MMANKVLALVGMCGAGKSVVTDYFTEKGYSCVYFGKCTMEEMQKRDLEINEENEKKVREELRKQYGMGVYAVLNLPKIEEALTLGNVIIDGLYSWSEYKVLHEKFGGNLVVLSVFTPRKMRYERLSIRGFRALTPEEAKKRDYSEIENLEKGGPIAIADYTVVNDGDREYLNEQLGKILI